jgi:hypothetical protein
MSQQIVSRWESMRTGETRKVEKLLRRVFPQTDAYRYNSASIRVRVTDPRFEGKSTEQRDGMVEQLIEELPKKTQADIINLLTLTPAERADFKSLPNAEFEDPTPSKL